MKQLSYRFIELTFFVPMRFIFKVDVYQFWCCNKTYWSVLCSYFSQQGIPIIRRHLCQTRPSLRDRRESVMSNASTFVTQCVTGWAKLSFYLNLSKITKAEESLPTSYFPLPTSHFQLPTSNFQLPTSDFRLPTSNFWHTYRFTVVFASGRQDLPSDSRAYSLKLF